MEHKPLHFFVTPPHECSYLPEKKAVTVFADPKAAMTTDLYSHLTHYGFRRSGEYVYRPDCPACGACLAARVDASAFEPRRKHRRVWQKNHDIKVIQRPAVYDDEHFELYRRYIMNRHPGGGMDDPDPDKYFSFLCSSWCDTRFYEFRLARKLLGVAVVDHLRQGLSAVYTFFDTDYGARSLGVFAVLWQVAEARELKLPWVYLGYWIKSCAKMSYKDQYQPLEVYYDGAWQRLGGDGTSLKQMG